ncbi:MAG: PQQ-binding-like beta-propeller repeat protein, partial [Planctomycetota bacterium]
LFTLSRRDGEVDRITNLAYPVESGPTLIDQLAIFGSGNGRVFAHHVDDGYNKWVYGLTGPIETRPVAENNQVFVADTQGRYATVESKTGELRWQGRTFGPVTANPVVDRAFIVVASEDQSLYSFVATTGRERWEPFRSEVPLTQAPTVIDGVIYLPEPGIGLTAIDGNTGVALWTIPDIPVPVTAHDGKILLNYETTLNTIDPATGETVLSVPTRPLERVVKGPADSLIVVSKEGEILRLDPE